MGIREVFECDVTGEECDAPVGSICVDLGDDLRLVVKPLVRSAADQFVGGLIGPKAEAAIKKALAGLAAKTPKKA